MDYPGFKIEVSGYTDNIGSKSYNKKLSYQRARSVLEYLIKKGVGKDLLIAKGYGEENPVVLWYLFD